VSQPHRPKIWLKRRRGRGRVVPVWPDDVDRRVWVNFGVANAYSGYAVICQEVGDRGEVETAGEKGGPVGGCKCARNRVWERPWVLK